MSHKDPIQLFYNKTYRQGDCRIWCGDRSSVTYRDVHTDKWDTISPRTFAWVHIGGNKRPPKNTQLKLSCGDPKCVERKHMYIQYPVYTKRGFLQRVVKNPKTKCWEWTGAYSSSESSTGSNRPVAFSPYIQVKSRVATHLALYIFLRKLVPRGMYALHTCDNEKCVNPEHLYVGTQQQNMDDMVDRGRSKSGTAKLSEFDVVRIYRLYHEEGYTVGQVHEQYAVVSKKTIDKIVYRQRWGHVTKGMKRRST